jgi:HAD superfamily hydrolase (TIGR01509 family)
MFALRGVLLDVDGTLIDSNLAHALSFQAALEMAGYRHPVEQILPLIGMGGEKLLGELDSKLTPQQITRIGKIKQELFVLEHLPSLKPFPGAAELVQQLARNKIPIAIASSASETELVPTLQTIGIAFLLRTAVKSSEVVDSKPSPDILEAASRQLNISPTELVLIGDTPYDIAAASRIDMPSIGFLCGGWSVQALEGAEEFYTGPWDLLKKWETSLLGRFSKGTSEPLILKAGSAVGH